MERGMVAGFTVIICVTIATAAYLITNHHPWWALLILLFGGSVSFKSKS